MNKISYLGCLLEAGFFSKDDARQLCSDILDKKINDHVIASILTLLSSRPYASSEVMGFREAIKERGLPIDLSCESALDVCGTGGDGKKTFNISTASAFIIASLGYKVVKHGNYAVSSSSGSSDILQSLGYEFSINADKLKKDIDRASVCFLHAPLFYHVLKEVAPIRKNLGIKTIFNVLGPLLNPANVKYQLTGVYDLSVLRTYVQVLAELKKRYLVVHSLDGHDEVSLTSKVRIQGNEVFIEDDPELGSVFGVRVRKVDPVNIQIGERDPKKLFLEFLEGKAHSDINEVVSLSAALAISLVDSKQPVSEIKLKAMDAILSGKGIAVLKNLIN